MHPKERIVVLNRPDVDEIQRRRVDEREYALHEEHIPVCLDIVLKRLTAASFPTLAHSLVAVVLSLFAAADVQTKSQGPN